MIRRALNSLKKRKIIKNFQQKARVELDAVFMLGASCRNDGEQANVKIGKHCTIGASFIALFGGRIEVGENTYLGVGTSIQAKQSIKISRNVIIANNVVIVDNNNHPTSPKMRLEMSACKDYMHDDLWSWKYAESAPVIIEENVWICRDVRIMKGVTIGKGSIVALGAIVVHDVPAYSIVAGNPARVVKRLPLPEEDK